MVLDSCPVVRSTDPAEPGPHQREGQAGWGRPWVPEGAFETRCTSCSQGHLRGPRKAPPEGTHQECSLLNNYNLTHHFCNHICFWPKTRPLLYFESFSYYVNHRSLASTYHLSLKSKRYLWVPAGGAFLAPGSVHGVQCLTIQRLRMIQQDPVIPLQTVYVVKACTFWCSLNAEKSL